MPLRLWQTVHTRLRTVLPGSSADRIGGNSGVVITAGLVAGTPVMAGGNSGGLAFSTTGFGAGLLNAFPGRTGNSVPVPGLRGDSLDCGGRNVSLSVWLTDGGEPDCAGLATVETLCDGLRSERIQ